MPESIFVGRDPELLKEMMGFYSYPEGKIYDVTANEKRMWKNLTQTNIIFSDVDRNMNPNIQCDFLNLPFKSNTGSIIIFDPPHLPEAAGSNKSLKPFVRRYGLDKTTSSDNISGIFKPFLIEAKRVLKQDGLIFVKLSDFVHNHKYQWILVDFVNAVRDIDGLTATDLRIKNDPSAGNLKSGKWVNSHHVRKSHCWWIIVRKGKCETKLPLKSLWG